MVKVFTKYDTVANNITIPCIRRLTKKELKPVVWGNINSALREFNQTGFMTFKELPIKKIIYGLEGVMFAHY